MKYVGIFFAIVLGAVLALAAVGFFLFWDNSPTTPGTGAPQQLAKPAVPAGGGFGLPSEAGGSGYVVQGAISIPASLRKVLDSKKDARVAVEAYLGTPVVSQEIGRFDGPLSPAQAPVKYFLRVSGNWANLLRGRASFPLYIRATICFDRPSTEHCFQKWTGTAMWGAILLKAQLPQLRDRQITIDVPNIVITSYAAPVADADCKQSGGTISGSIQPTQAYLSSPGRVRKLVLLGVPRSVTLPPPYSPGPDPRWLTKAELDKMGDAGVVRQDVNLSGPNPIPFSLKIPDKFQGDHYELFLASCREGQPADECAEQAFPIYLLHAGLDQSRGLYKLVRPGFMFATCGSRGQTYYLHSWSGGNWPTDASVSKANPPEIIEGAMY